MRGGLSRISLIVYSARTLTVRFYFAARRKDIIRTMESFNNNLQGGKKLVKSLEKQSPVSVLQAPATPAVIATGASVRRLPAAPPTTHAHAHAAARPQMPPSTLYSRPMLQG